MRAQRAGRRIGSFDRTYEGLKRGHGDGVPHDLPAAFDRTYEGLKLKKSLVEERSPRTLLTVPMRV